MASADFSRAYPVDPGIGSLSLLLDLCPVPFLCPVAAFLFTISFPEVGAHSQGPVLLRSDLWHV